MSASSQPEVKYVNTSVDLIRVVAVILVIFFYAASFPLNIPEKATPGVMSNWWTSNFYGSIGPLGVPLLVMLSGALLLDSTKADEPIGYFFKKRFYRIGIPLAFWTVIYFIWSFYVLGYKLTTDSILQGIFSGAYPHLWFLYLLIGLYLATPVLRVLVKNLDRQRFKYLLILIFVGTIIPSLTTFISFEISAFLFVFAGWVGYYLLGVFLKDVEFKQTRLLFVGVIVGIVCSIVGTYFLTDYGGGIFFKFFYNSLNFNVILASAALFLLLINIPAAKINTRSAHFNGFIHWISENSLPIYLINLIVLETFERGFLWVRISVYTMNAIIAIPLLVIITLLVSSVIVFVLKKIPHMEEIIG